MEVEHCCASTDHCLPDYKHKIMKNITRVIFEYQHKIEKQTNTRMTPVLSGNPIWQRDDLITFNMEIQGEKLKIGLFKAPKWRGGE